MKVFVTYAWDKSAEFNEKVYSFVAMLRTKGFDAFCDKTEMQNSTAPRFPRIMNDGLNSDKVIVVLNSEYKKKADMSETGVGIEYEIISSEFRKEQYSKKIYICLV